MGKTCCGADVPEPEEPEEEPCNRPATCLKTSPDLLNEVLVIIREKVVTALSSRAGVKEMEAVRAATERILKKLEDRNWFLS